MSGLDTILSHPASQATAWALVHFLWQGTAVALLLAGVLLVLPRRMAQLRYTAAALALGAMLVLPVVTAVAIATGGRSDAGAGSLTGTLRSAAAPVFTALRDLSAAPAPGSGGSSPAPDAAWLQVVVAVWLAGVALLSTRNLGSWIGVRRLTRSGTFPVPEAWHAALGDLGRRLRLSRPVRLLGSHRVSVPTVVGWLRPAVLVPVSALTGLGPGELEALLAHELAHVRRHDYLLNLVQTFVETLLFYHPAVWWVSRQIRIERENACDDMAAACCGDARRVAAALARMETLRAASPAFALGADGGSLLSRITRLAGLPAARTRGDRRLPGTLALLGVLALGGGLVALQVRPSDAELASSRNGVQGPAVVVGGSTAPAVSVTVPATGTVAGITAGAEVVAGDQDTAPVLAQNRSSEHWSWSDDGDWSSGRGKWEARYQDGHVSIEGRVGHSRWGESGDVEDYGFSRADVEALLSKNPISFRIPREAGAFIFEGKSDAHGGGINAQGTFRFEPDPDYVDKMKALGYDAGDVRDRQMELAAHDVSTEFVKDLASLGYRDLSLDRLVEFRIHGVNADYVRGMAEAGFKDLPPERIVEFKIHGIDPGYVRGMAEAGFKDLPPERIVEFKIHGIDPGYVRSMAEAGFKDLPPERIVEFKIHGIDPEYVRGMAEAGFKDLPPERIVEFKIHGIDPGYVHDLAASGYRDLPPERVVEFKIHGIGADYVRGMAEAGYADLPAKKLVEMRIHGITPEYVRGLGKAGYADLPADRLIEFKIHGIDAEYAKGLGVLGYGKLDPEKLVEMRIHGVTPDSVRRLQDRGLTDLTPDEIIEIHIRGVDRFLRDRREN